MAIFANMSIFVFVRIWSIFVLYSFIFAEIFLLVKNTDIHNGGDGPYAGQRRRALRPYKTIPKRAALLQPHASFKAGGGKLTETYGNCCANGTQAFPKRLETDDGNAVVIDFWKLGGETFISNVPGRYNIRLMSRGAVSVAVCSVVIAKREGKRTAHN